MKNLPKRVKRIILLLISFLFFTPFLYFTGSKAEESITSSGTGLRISPPIFELTLQKGEATQEIIKLENIGTTVQTYYPIVYSFIPKGEEGSQEFMLPEEGDKTYSLAKWINITAEEITLQPKEKIATTFTITTPKDAEAGGRYAGILFSTTPPPSSGQPEIKVSTQTGPIILGRIAGPTTEQGSIIEFSTDKKSYNYLPVKFTTRFRNTGDVHIKPFGGIEISNLFGKKVDELIVNEKLGNVLPQSIRKFENEWNRNQLTLGRYTAKITLVYGESNDKSTTETLTFWVLPWKEIIIGAVLSILALVLLILAIKKYNAWIIKKALQEQKVKKEKE